MLVLSRRVNEKILFPEIGIEISILRIKAKNASVGIIAPQSIRIVRSELEPREKERYLTEPTAEVPGGSEIDIESIQAQLDAANLALYLAQNQLNHGEEAACSALDQAMESFGKLERLLAKHPQWRQCVPPEGQVKERSSAYSIGKSAAWVVVDPERGEACDTVVDSLVKEDFEVTKMSTKELFIEIESRRPSMLLIHEPASNAAIVEAEGEVRCQPFIATLPGIPSLTLCGQRAFGEVQMSVWRS